MALLVDEITRAAVKCWKDTNDFLSKTGRSERSGLSPQTVDISSANSAVSILKMMDDDHIFDIIRKDGKFIIGERCDEYFRRELTADELRQLGREIIELADSI